MAITSWRAAAPLSKNRPNSSTAQLARYQGNSKSPFSFSSLVFLFLVTGSLPSFLLLLPSATLAENISASVNQRIPQGVVGATSRVQCDQLREQWSSLRRSVSQEHDRCIASEQCKRKIGSGRRCQCASCEEVHNVLMDQPEFWKQGDRQVAACMASVKSSENRQRENAARRDTDFQQRRAERSGKNPDLGLNELDSGLYIDKSQLLPTIPGVPQEMRSPKETMLRNRDGKDLRDAVNEAYEEFTDKAVKQGVGVVEHYKPWAKYNGPDARIRESSALADDVYDASKAVKENGRWVIKEEVCALDFCGVQTQEYQPPQGYVLKLARTGANGFGAAVYENIKTGERTVAYVGTQDMEDVATDMDLAGKTIPPGGSSIAERALKNPVVRFMLQPDGKWDSQVKQSLDFFAEARTLPPSYPLQTPGSQAERLYVTGHSLGGGLSQVVGARYQAETQTFNAPGIPEETITKYIGTIRSSLPITNHIRQHDLVGNFGDHIGTTTTWQDLGRGERESMAITPGLNAGGRANAAQENHSIGNLHHDFESDDGMKGSLATPRDRENEKADRAINIMDEPPSKRP